MKQVEGLVCCASENECADNPETTSTIKTVPC